MADPVNPASPPNVDPLAAQNEQGDGRQVLLQKFFVKDASIEVPNAPQVFTKAWKPDVDVQVNSRVQDMTQDQWQVILTITVTAKLGDETAFLVEAHQAGLFLLKGFNTNAERGAVLGAYCPALIFPFARETIADLVQRAGFPQLLLQPINFDALYLQHQRQQAASASAAANPEAGSATVTH
jgi:preprotein translocase subunit SecB